MKRDDKRRKPAETQEQRPEEELENIIDVSVEGEGNVTDAPVAGAAGQNEAPASDTEQATAAVEAELADLRERLLRTAADFDNYRKQTAARVDKARRQEQDRVLLSFLPVIDNLERALAAHEGEENPWVEGMRAIRKQMLDALKSFGAIRFEAGGAEFDPEHHEAVARIPVATETESRVVEVIEPGYERESGEILRPAKVVVGYRPDGEGGRA